MNFRFRLLVLGLISALLAAPCSTAQGRDGGWIFRDIIPGGHRGAVRAALYHEEKILSVGDDGFLEIWNLRTRAAEERFQLSPYRIESMVLRPGKPEICLAESDGLGLYRISLWNFRDKVNLFTLRFRDPVSYINYSAGGNFLIVARRGSTGLVFIHPETGEVLQSPPSLTGMVGFAATGRSERNMIVYFSGGTLSYWDLESGEETERFQVPPNITSPVIFGNNRFFAGFDPGGLVILDAVSGAVLDRNPDIPEDSLLYPGRNGSEFLCIAETGGPPELLYFSLDASRKAVIRERLSLPQRVSAAAAFNNGFALGTAGGEVWVSSKREPPRAMTEKKQVRVLEAAVSGSVLAFIAEGDLQGFLPLDYFRLAGTDLHLGQNQGYTRITPFPGEGEEKDAFLFWQTDNTRLYPALRPADPGGSPLILQDLPLRFPLRAAAVFGKKSLFLDSAGNISVMEINVPAKTSALHFSFSSIGSMDAAFADGENIILGRSALSGNSPFLLINLITGETVPLAFPSSAGARVYRGLSGAVYGAAVDPGPGAPRTSIVKLDIKNPSQAIPLVEYQGEDTLFSLAESSGTLASTLGAGGAALFSPRGMLNFERSPGLPLKLVEGGSFFVVIDGDGNICWHDPLSGNLLAIFRLYLNEWILQQSHGEILYGRVNQDQ
jgi:hypothetical protein